MVFNQYLPEIFLRSGEHILIVTIAMLIAIAIGIPLGILITRQPQIATPILTVANGIQTIPSLAIFGFLISIPFIGGIGKTPAIVALTLYSLLPLIRNTYIGINGIDPAIREAGRGMGMTDWQLLTQVELPLASGVILAGVRVATVLTVGVATIAAVIGGGGLGLFIFRGISTVNNQLLLAGAIPAILIALAADFSLGWLEKRYQQHEQKLTINRKFAISIAGLMLGLIGTVIVLSQLLPPTIVIGSKNFTEAVILGELLSQQIESHTTLKIDRRFNLGGTFIAHEAVKAGQIAGYVEYTGTALTAILKQQPISDPQAVFEKVKQEYNQQFQLEVMPSLGFNNTYAMIVRGEDAKRWQVKTLSDLAPYTPEVILGCFYEFLERKDGYQGLVKTYGFKFNQPPKQLELGLLYQALKEKKVDLIAAATTDGLIPVLDLVILEDNKNYFPPYEAIPVFNQRILNKYPEIRSAIAQLTGLISTADMQKMNYQVDNSSESVESVVREFLKSKGL